VPATDAPALGFGKLLHCIFEDYFNGMEMKDAIEKGLYDYAHGGGSDPRVVSLVSDLAEALCQWREQFPVTEVLEVEEPFELVDAVDPRVIWLGRPDRMVITGGKLWHMQNRGLGAQTNFGVYTRLAKRHYHEHIYAEAMHKKYPEYKYGGTIFNLVRKLKYRTYVGTVREAVKSLEEMFWQGVVTLDLDGPLHASVMMSMRQHADEMIRCHERWHTDEFIPAPNEKMNGGFNGNYEDEYFQVLIGKVSLDDNSIFKNREDTYAPTPPE
jgi:hypothetical protein